MKFLYRYLHLSGLLVTLIFSVNVFAQKQPSVDSNAVALQFVDRLFPDGNYTAEVLGIPRAKESQVAVVEKMKLAIKDNEDWFLKAMKELKPGEPMPYHKNLGISEEEYKDFMQFSKSIKIDKVGTIKCKIIRRDSVIHFEPEGYADYLKYLEIHLKDQTVIVDSILLQYKTQITKDAKRTTLVAGPWKGYSWQLEELRRDGQLVADPDKVDPTEIRELDLKFIEVIIGKLDHSDQCFLYLKSSIVNKGHVLAKQDIALLLIKE